MKHRINIHKLSRSGRARLKAVIVVSTGPTQSREEVDSIRRKINEIRPDANGILWLVTPDQSKVKVYPIK